MGWSTFSGRLLLAGGRTGGSRTRGFGSSRGFGTPASGGFWFSARGRLFIIPLIENIFESFSVGIKERLGGK